MAEELTKEEIDERARELARRVMSRPYEKQEWPRKSKTSSPSPIEVEEGPPNAVPERSPA